MEFAADLLKNLNNIRQVSILPLIYSLAKNRLY